MRVLRTLLDVKSCTFSFICWIFTKMAARGGSFWKKVKVLIEAMKSKLAFANSAIINLHKGSFANMISNLKDGELTINQTASFRTQYLSLQNSGNHWRAARFDASAIRSLKSVSQDGGLDVKLVNISRGGALIESPERKSLGSRISLRLATEEEVYLLKGRIIRTRRCRGNDKVLKYQYAIMFDKDFSILPTLLL